MIPEILKQVYILPHETYTIFVTKDESLWYQVAQYIMKVRVDSMWIGNGSCS